MKYAILNADQQSVRDVREFEILPVIKPGLVRPLVVDAHPAHNAATQRVAEAGFVIEATHVRRTWQVVALNTAELDASARLAKKAACAQAIPTLRTWASDAGVAVNTWDAQTTAEKLNRTKLLFTRFGVLCSRMADLLEAQRIDQ